MLKNVYLKDIYQRRMGIMLWSAGVVFLVLVTASLFHSLSSTFQQTAQSLPVAVRGLIGDSESFTNFNAFMNQQVFIKSMSLFGVIYSIILFSGLLAGEEGEGTLQVVLTQPISRSKLVLQKFAAGATLLAIFCAATFVSCVLGGWFIHESISYSGTAQACLSLWLLSLLFGTLAFMFGAITGKRASAAPAGAMAFMSYFITSLAAGVKSLQGVSKFMPNRYYTRGDYDVVAHGLHVRYVGGFLVATLFLLLIAIVRFTHRDIYQK